MICSQFASSPRCNAAAGACLYACLLFTASASYAQEPFFELQKLIPQDVTGGETFGGNIDTRGDQAFIGCVLKSGGRGAVYDYRYDPDTGLWEEHAKLAPPGLDPMDLFGSHISFDDRWLFIGAYGDDDGGSASGAAYAYERVADEWTLRQKLTSPDPEWESYFGNGVCILGEWAFLGSRNKDDHGRNSGALYLYRLVDETWTFQTKLAPPGLKAYDEYGTAIACNGDWAVIGASGDDDGGSNAGAVYFYRRDGSDWIFDHKELGSAPAPNAALGLCVDMEGPLAVLSTQYGECAYLFELDGSVWRETHRFTASDGQPGDSFGVNTKISEGTIVAGSMFHQDAGAAYVFTPDDAGGWIEQKLMPADSAPEDWFGQMVAIDGNMIMSIAQRDDNSHGGNAGAAYVFTREEMLTVEIDIKPHSYPNVINLKSKGVVPIAVFSTFDFDATQIDPATVYLAGAAVAVRGGKNGKYMAHIQDVDGDDLDDLLLHFETEQIDPDQLIDDIAWLTGFTFDGTEFEGSDEVCIVPR